MIRPGPRRLAILPRMAILLDPVTTHNTDNLGNDTIPPGITGLDWCHLVSDTSLAELTAFLDAHPEIGQPSSNVRTPAIGSLITYAGLDQAMHDAAIAAGAVENNKRFVVSHAFDSNDQSVYEPGWT